MSILTDFQQGSQDHSVGKIVLSVSTAVQLHTEEQDKFQPYATHETSSLQTCSLNKSQNIEENKE